MADASTAVSPESSSVITCGGVRGASRREALYSAVTTPRPRRLAGRGGARGGQAGPGWGAVACATHPAHEFLRLSALREALSPHPLREPEGTRDGVECRDGRLTEAWHKTEFSNSRIQQSAD